MPIQQVSGYSQVNGLDMYYEIYGSGKPLLLIHGGGSTIQTTFGNIIPLLAQARQVIAVELQAHGHTSDRSADLSFEQDADDVATLLINLQVSKVDLLGFSNGGHTAIALVLRHPELIDRLILASTFYKRSATSTKFWEGFDHARLDQMPEVLKAGYLVANNSSDGLLNMFNKDVQRMKVFVGWTDGQIQSIKAKTLIINGNHDVGSVEHALEMHHMIPTCDLAIFPGGHGDYLGAIESLHDGKWSRFNATSLIEEFLDKK
jgi:pimeloyl-ACP methyl ester carboxylesterase